jgi:alpha-D-ribose 1-methylphosphonate 5-triphosphate synthase subunit PhnH
MNGGMNLADVGRGFDDVALGSQAVFRQALTALSRPGEIVDVSTDAETPAGLHPAASALLLALLDQDTRLWLAPSLADGPAAAYLRFHTGCVLVERAADAAFALVGTPNELPPLAAFARGSEEYPERSATVIVQVSDLSGERGWTLTGPGIDGRATLGAAGLGASFIAEWDANRRAFPCGIDVFFTCGALLAGLPRTARIGA